MRKTVYVLNKQIELKSHTTPTGFETIVNAHSYTMKALLWIKASDGCVNANYDLGQNLRQNKSSVACVHSCETHGSEVNDKCFLIMQEKSV